MEPFELSIYNLVKTPEPGLNIPMCILSVDELGRADVWQTDHKYGNRYNVEELAPIPIDDDLLKRSFFTREHSIFGHNYVCTKLKIKIHLRYNKHNAVWILRCNNNLMRVKYIHQLQNALILCGIKEDLFPFV